MQKPEILLVGDYDWANTGFRFSKCLRILGLDALMIKAKIHPFLYPEQAIVHPGFSGQMVKEIPPIEYLYNYAKVVHFIGSIGLDGMPVVVGKKYVVQHGGTIYREGHEQINKYFNEFCHAAIIQCPDLLGLGAKNEHLIYYPVDTEFIKPVYERSSEKVVIGHFPSNPNVKGSAGIERVIDELRNDPDVKDRFEYVSGRDACLPWIKNLKRMSKCDVIIETCNPELNGKKYGEWGNTALEAAALGKVVITNSLHQDVYSKEYGDCQLVIANDTEQLKEQVKSVLMMHDNVLEAKKRSTRKWAEDNHSMYATANRLWEKVYKPLMEDM